MSLLRPWPRGHLWASLPSLPSQRTSTLVGRPPLALAWPPQAGDAAELLFETGWWPVTVLEATASEGTFRVASSVNRPALKGLEGSVPAPRVRPAWSWSGLEAGGHWQYVTKAAGRVQIDPTGRVHKKPPPVAPKPAAHASAAAS